LQESCRCLVRFRTSTVRIFIATIEGASLKPLRYATRHETKRFASDLINCVC
jgi:hypothetical protein